MFDRQNAFYLGNLGPIPLFVHWSFIFLLLMAFNFSNAGRADLVNVLVYLLVLLSGIVLHELGHGLAARAQGATGVTITLWAFGGLCSSKRDAVPWREIIILAAGPLVSFMLAFGCKLALTQLARSHPEWIVDADGLSLVGHMLWMGYSVNLVLGIFNIMPIYPLDGGQIVFNTCKLFTREMVAAKISLAIAVLAALGYLAYDIHNRGELNSYLVVLLLYLLMNAFMSLR
jgi:Zn-dependent protease